MARVTVEDCLEVVENRFELVVIASQRAKLLASGAQLTVSRDNDKNPVVALREIAERNVNVPILREMVIKNLQREGKFDSKEEETDLDNDVIEHDEMGIIDEIEALGVDNMDFDLDDMSFEDDTNLDLDE